MFAFVVNGEFKGLWANRVGDIFFENTCKSMKWDSSATTLLYFENFTELNSENNLFEFEENKIIFYEALKNENQEITGKGQKESEIIGQVFAENGLMSIAC